jgi:hypothetical protein
MKKKKRKKKAAGQRIQSGRSACDSPHRIVHKRALQNNHRVHHPAPLTTRPSSSPTIPIQPA